MLTVPWRWSTGNPSQILDKEDSELKQQEPLESSNRIALTLVTGVEYQKGSVAPAMAEAVGADTGHPEAESQVGL